MANLIYIIPLSVFAALILGLVFGQSSPQGFNAPVNKEVAKEEDLFGVGYDDVGFNGQPLDRFDLDLQNNLFGVSSEDD